jgi:hypothetical protein
MNLKALTALFLAVVIPWACRDRSEIELSDRELVGKWVPDAASSEWIAEKADQSACHLQLESDGVLSGVAPDYMLRSRDESRGQVFPIAGTWSLARSTSGASVELKLTKSALRPGRLWLGGLDVERDAEGVLLCFSIGDPDNLKKFDFRRQISR